MTDIPEYALEKPIVENILHKLRKCVETKHYIIVSRRKNLRFMAEEGLTYEDLEDILCGMTYDDYYKSDTDRDDPTGQDIYWFFRPYYQENKLYVKFKIWFEKGDLDTAYIKSLHKDEDF